MKKAGIAAFALATALTCALQARESVVIVGAHPDDLIGCAGTAFRLREKFDIHLVDFTHGERGLGEEKFRSGYTKATRTREETEACELLGAKLHWLDEVDGEAYACRETVARIAGLLSGLKPRAVITHWPLDIHNDHAMTAAAVLKALQVAKVSPEVYFMEEAHQSKWFDAAIYVDITDVVDLKRDLIRKYVCQNGADSLVEEERINGEIRGKRANPLAIAAEAFVPFQTVRPGKACIFDEIGRPAYNTFVYGRRFKIMSYNVRHCQGMDGRLDLARTARTISAEQPRFAALQELDTGAERSGFVDEPAELGRLTGMHATFAQAIPYEKGGYGVALLSREKPLSVERLPLPGVEPRVLLLAEFEDCWVGCTHLDLKEENRLKSLQTLREAVARREKPVFLCGDWNAFPDSAVLAGVGKFAKVISGTGGSTFHGLGKDGSKPADYGKCIDYIAVDSEHDKHVRVFSARTVEDRISSDHAPITAVVELRGAALPPAPFPDRMSAFVWRNWFCVPADRLARAVGATVADLEGVAAEMGLPAPQPEVLPEWRRKGYITVVRRNWHLLPVEQLLTVLDMTRDEFEFSLKEDDFLYVKLGSIKPVCAPLRWDGKSVAATRQERAKIAKILEEEGLSPAAPVERRFSFVADLSRADPGWKQKPFNCAFKSRGLMSYFADFGDPLADPEVRTYPEGLLQKLSDVGITRITVPIVLSTMIADPFRPELSAEAERRLATLNELVRRAKRCGITVGVYFNEPRARPDDFFKASSEREAMRGAKGYQGYSICLSSEEGRRWTENAIAELYRRVPDLGGLGLTTASENQTHCGSHGQQEGCPRCRHKSRRELIAEAVTVMAGAARRAAPDRIIGVSTWAWPKDDVEWILRHIPHEMTGLGCTSEGGLEIERGGVKSTVGEYSISAGGPSPRSAARWRLGKELGMETGATTLTGGTWEFSAIPAVPALDLLAEHAFALKELGVDNVSLSWSVGCYPSPNQLVFSRMGKSTRSAAEVLDHVALEWYGDAKAVPVVRRAWTAFSDGFREYPFHIKVVYRSPIHMGPANPLYQAKTEWESTMVGIPYDDLANWRGIYPADVWISQMEKVGDGFERGCRLWEDVVASLSGAARSRAERELGTYRAALLHFRSVCDQARFVLARDRGDRDEMKRLAMREIATAKALLPLVRADARIGYECSNNYFYTPYDLIEKVVGCRQIADAADGAK